MDIRRIQDISLTDIELRTRYYGLISAGMIDEAKLMVINYPQLRGKVLSSEMLNQFVESVMELEQNYYTEVEDFLLEQRQDLQLSIDELVYMSEYDNSNQYEVNNFVSYGDNVYYCYVIPPIGTLPTDSDYWIELNIMGERAILSLGVQFVGTWNIARQYSTKEMVIYQNKMYVARKNSLGTVPTNDEYWILAIDNKPQTIYVGATEPEFVQVGSMWIKVLNPTYEGSFVNFKSDEGVNLSMELQGKSVQNGTPTPENKVDIISVGDNGSVVVKVTGKNVLNLPNGTYVKSGITATVKDGTINVTGTATANSLIEIPFAANLNGNYTLSANNLVSYTIYELIRLKTNSDSLGIVTLDKPNAKGTFSASNASIVSLVVRTNNGSTVNYTMKPQLELGTNSTTYEQGKEQLITIPLTQPLRSVGSVYDRGCVKSNGLWGVERKFISVIFDGSSDEITTTFPAQASADTLLFQLSIDNNPGISRPSVMSNRFATATTDIWSTSYNTEAIYVGGTPDANGWFKRMDIRINKSRLTTQDISGLKTWLASNPLTVIYELATPIFESYPQALQDKLNALQTYQGVTNVFTTDALQPNMIVTYNNK